MPKAFLINYDDCFGCHACEVACQMLHNLPPDQFGIKIASVGPWPYGDKKWQYDYVPLLTNQCTHCASRIDAGKLPTCVQHCGAQCLKFGEMDDLYVEFKTKPKQILQPVPEG